MHCCFRLDEILSSGREDSVLLPRIQRPSRISSSTLLFISPCMSACHVRMARMPILRNWTAPVQIFLSNFCEYPYGVPEKGSRRDPQGSRPHTSAASNLLVLLPGRRRESPRVYNVHWGLPPCFSLVIASVKLRCSVGCPWRRFTACCHLP